MLTIAIPTYNRNATLLKHLEHLLPQMTSECRLLIIDNASDVPVSQTLAGLLARFPDVQVEIKRNRANIGANANILRCFELCETTWLWTLSDDDVPKPDAVATIFEHLHQQPDCLCFNFATEHGRRRQTTTLTTGAVDFVNKIDNYGNAIWISTNVYRVEALMSSLKFAHHYTYGAAPQLVMVLKSLHKSEVCCLSHCVIVTLGQMEGLWSHVVLALGIRTLLEMPLEPPVRAGLARHLTLFDDDFLLMRPLVYQLILSALSTNDHHGPLYLYDQLCLRRHCGYYADARIHRRIEAYLYRFLVKYPRFGFKLTALYRLRIKAPASENELQSASERL